MKKIILRTGKGQNTEKEGYLLKTPTDAEQLWNELLFYDVILTDLNNMLKDTFVFFVSVSDYFVIDEMLLEETEIVNEYIYNNE